MIGGLGCGTKETSCTGTREEKTQHYYCYYTSFLSELYACPEMNTIHNYSLTTCKCTGLLVLIWFPVVTLQKYSPSDLTLTLRGNVIGLLLVARTWSLSFMSSKVRGDGDSGSLHSNITVDFRKAILGPVSSGLRVDPSAHKHRDWECYYISYYIILY